MAFNPKATQVTKQRRLPGFVCEKVISGTAERRNFQMAFYKG